MNKKMQIEHLARLLHLEVHVVSGYDTALDKLPEGDDRTRVQQMRGEHERHVLDITELLREIGEPTPANTGDVDGLVAPAFAALRNASGERDVLQAVRINEQTVGRMYEEARSWGVGLQVHELLERHDLDEQRHVAAVEEMLGAGARSGGRR